MTENKNPKKNSSVCVVIPAYNEADNIANLLKQLKKNIEHILVVDDGSADNTYEIVKDCGVHCIRHEQNKGKGVSLEDGYKYVCEKGFSYVITMDGDGQHSPEDIPKFLEVLQQTGADIIVGNRMQDTASMPWERYLTNKLTSWVISKMAGQKIYDTQCGFRLLATKIIDKITLTTQNYDSESEVLIKAGRSGYKIESVPVLTIYGNRKSNIRPIRDTIRFFSLIFRLSKKDT